MHLQGRPISGSQAVGFIIDLAAQVCCPFPRPRHQESSGFIPRLIWDSSRSNDAISNGETASADRPAGLSRPVGDQFTVEVLINQGVLTFKRAVELELARFEERSAALKMEARSARPAPTRGHGESRSRMRRADHPN